MNDMQQYYKTLESFLIRIDPMEVMKKISEFRRKNIRDISDEGLFEAIQHTLTNNNLFSYITNGGKYSEGTYFFRVRKLNSSIISEMNIKEEKDLWEPPEECVKSMGRLNKIRESLLYTSPTNPNVAIKETHIQKDDWYALIKYTANKDVKVNIIGGTYDYKALGFTNDTAIMVHELYNNFLRDEFSRDVGIGTEFLYRVSERIAKDYFDLPSEMQDAWCYSSVQNKEQYNVCFRPDKAHELLQLNGAMICKKEDDELIRPRCVAVVEDGKVAFYPLGSIAQKKSFPEMSYNV